MHHAGSWKERRTGLDSLFNPPKTLFIFLSTRIHIPGPFHAQSITSEEGLTPCPIHLTFSRYCLPVFPQDSCPLPLLHAIFLSSFLSAPLSPPPWHSPLPFCSLDIQYLPNDTYISPFYGFQTRRQPCERDWANHQEMINLVVVSFPDSIISRSDCNSKQKKFRYADWKCLQRR